jgi:hypothetical protein
MIYLSYERGLITKAEIDRMLKQVDEFDGSCLSVIAERKRQWQQQHGEDERGIRARGILSRLENWVIGWGKAKTEMRPGRNVDRSGTDRGRALRLSGKSDQSSLPPGEDERERQQRADHREF